MIDINAIVYEILTEPTTNKQLVIHLKSANFFNVAQVAESTAAKIGKGASFKRNRKDGYKNKTAARRSSQLF